MSPKKLFLNSNTLLMTVFSFAPVKRPSFVLKDRLTNLARNYMLWPENDGMCGRGGNARFASGYASEIWGLTKGFEPISLRLRKK